LRDEVFDLNDRSLGDAQLEALLCDSALIPAGKVRCWRLPGARISSVGAAALGSAMQYGVRIIDLSRNELGTNGVEAIRGLMAGYRLTSLRSLNLSANGLRSDAVAALCQALDDCQLLLRLELNHNELREGSSLGGLLAGHVSLTRLALHGNNLSGMGGADLFRGAVANSRVGGRLADIDVAWNGLSNDAGAMECGTVVAELLRESSTLYHLDLSYNGLKEDCCGVIADALRDNHQLYGLHMVGNAVTMDANGFLQALPSPEQITASPQPGTFHVGDPRSGVSQRVGSKHQPQPHVSICDNSGKGGAAAARDVTFSDTDILRDRDHLEEQSTCWACEGWECLEFEWCVQDNEVHPSDDVWAFTSLDSFKFGLQLNREPGGSRFTGARMVPPNKQILVVYQVGTSLLTAPNAVVQSLDAPAAIKLRPTVVNVTDGAELVPPCPVCYISEAGIAAPSKTRPRLQPNGLAGTRVVIIGGPDGPVQMPRVTETEFRARIERVRPKSLLQVFKRVTPSVLQEAFRLDWSLVKKGRLVPESEDVSVGCLLEAAYGRILALYRQLSAIDIFGSSAFGVTSLEAGSFAVEIGLVDGQVTKLSDIDRFFIAANVIQMEQRKSLVVRNDRGLVRYQFLELLLRIADHHFSHSSDVSKFEDAVRSLLEHLWEASERRLRELDAFFSYLHTDDVDDVYRKHLPSLETVYHRVSVRARRAGHGCFICHADFQTLLEQIGAYDSEFQQRYSCVAFRMGMVTQADEYHSSRFQEMGFLEFLHALGAVVFFRSGLRAGSCSQDFATLIDDFFSKHLTLAAAPGRVGVNVHVPETHGL
jgi:hypothetical protein